MESMRQKFLRIWAAAVRRRHQEPGPSISRNPMRGIEDMVEQNDNSFDGVINNVKVEPAAGTPEIVQDDKKSVLEKLRERSRQIPVPVPEPERKPVPGCCFEREITGW